MFYVVANNELQLETKDSKEANDLLKKLGKKACIYNKKYTYYKVVQSNLGYGWSDETHYEMNSTFTEYKETTKKDFKEDLFNYRETYLGFGQIRVVNRKEKNWI